MATLSATGVSAYDRLVAALEAHGQHGRNGSWTCPAHEDRNPSLSVSRGRVGVTLHCHAGCDAAAVVAAIGLTMEDLFDEQRTKPEEEAVYPYHDEDGRLLYEVVRMRPKAFRQRRPLPGGGHEWRLGDIRRVLYRLPDVQRAVAAGDPVWITEGEKDAEALVRHGVCATCNAGGAGKWRQDYGESLRDASVVIVSDRDKPGRKHAQAVHDALLAVAKSVRVVEPAAGKDAYDHLAAGLGLDAFVGEVAEPDSWEPLDLVAVDAHPVEPPEILAGDEGGGLFYAGVRHLISGPPESLKSWVGLVASVEQIAAGRHVVWIDFDAMGPADTLERLRALGAEDSAISRLFHYIAPDRSLDERGRGHIERLRGLQPAVVVIDAQNPGLFLEGLKPTVMEDIEAFNRTHVNPWARAGASVLVLDHVVKDAENRGSWAFGSERKAGAVQVHIGLQPHEDQKLTRETPATVRVIAHKDRPGWHKRATAGAIGEVTFTPDGSGRVGWRLVLGVMDEPAKGRDSFRPTGLMEKVSRYLEQAGGAHSVNQIERSVKGRAEFIRKGIERLVEDGHLESVRGDRGAQMHTLVRRYRQSEDPASDKYEAPEAPPRPSSSQFVPDEVEREDRPRPVGGPPPFQGGDHGTRSSLWAEDENSKSDLVPPDYDWRQDLPEELR